MLALVKTAPGPGLTLTDGPGPGHRHQRRPDPRPQDRHLRHGPAHRVVGPVGGRRPSSRRWSPATSSWARSSRWAPTSTTSTRATSCRGEGHVTCGRCRHCLAGRRHLCANTVGLGVGRDGAFAEYVALPMTNVWHHWPGIDEDVAAIFDPFGNAVHTALAFPVLGEDVLITGAGPIGLMATAVVRHAGARFVVVSEPNPVRRDAGDAHGRHGRRRPARARPRATSSASWAWSRASTWRSRCPARPAAIRARDGQHGPRRLDRDPGHPHRRTSASTSTRSCSSCSRSGASTAGRCTRPGTR